MTSDNLKRALIVVDCGLRWPTGMVRAMQFKPLFDHSVDWRAEFVSRHPDFVVKLLYGKHKLHKRIFIRAFRPLLKSYYDHWSRRQDERIVTRAPEFDVVCIVKSPSLNLYRRLCQVGHPRILMDINDAVWLQKRGDWADLDVMLSEVHGVICENNCIANYVSNFNRRAFVIDDAPQIEVFDNWRDKIQRDSNRVVLGWIGGSANIGPLYKILESLETLFIRHPNLHLRVVGAPDSALPPFENVRVSCLPTYSQEEMVKEILQFDIGLFPLFHNDDGRARGTLKAKVYMSGEAVAVCENYGENTGFIRDGHNGILVSSQQEWHDKLDWLITHPTERAAIAKRGLETIQKNYTAKHVFERILAAYNEVMAV